MAKSDWQKLELLLADYAEIAGYDVQTDNGDVVVISCTKPVSLTDLARALADHVTITNEPVLVKS